jgi:hypothetical protein
MSICARISLTGILEDRSKENRGLIAQEISGK